MRVLVLGGTHYVGRAVVEAALVRGDEVSTLNRGLSAPAIEGIESLIADRTDLQALRRAIGDRKWEVIIDTWSGAPRIVAASSALLADRAQHFGYVSTWVVYEPPIPYGANEYTAVIDGDPDDEADAFYPSAKRGAELAVLRAFGNRALIARPGPILGPYEDVGSLTWWLRRIERGRRVLAPGTPGDPFQYVDVRDLADWMLNAADRRTSGTFNIACARGRYTMGELLETMCLVTSSEAELVWVDNDVLIAEGIRPYFDIPLWLPAAMWGGINDVEVTAAHRTGLDTSRPLQDTIADTWAWLQREGEPSWQRTKTRRGLDPATEQRVLEQVG